MNHLYAFSPCLVERNVPKTLPIRLEFYKSGYWSTLNSMEWNKTELDAGLEETIQTKGGSSEILWRSYWLWCMHIWLKWKMGQPLPNSTWRDPPMVRPMSWLNLMHTRHLWKVPAVQESRFNVVGLLVSVTTFKFSAVWIKITRMERWNISNFYVDTSTTHILVSNCTSRPSVRASYLSWFSLNGDSWATEWFEQRVSFMNRFLG